MRISGKIALWAFLLSGCAAELRQPVLVDCPKESALARGTVDGAGSHKADLGFLKSCSAESRVEALAAYREGYAKARPRHKNLDKASDAADELDDSPEGSTTTSLLLSPPVREPSAVSWVCEVEASSRVFTGVGVTRDEALDSARSTCGSHFQASYCTKSDCKQTL